MSSWPTLRGILLFFAGLAGEVVLTVAWLGGTEPNQSLMLLFATMMGLPVFLRSDEKPPPPDPPGEPREVAAGRADRPGGSAGP